MSIKIISILQRSFFNNSGNGLHTDSSTNSVFAIKNIRQRIKLITKLVTLSAITLIMLVFSEVQAESKYQGILGLGINRAIFDDQLVAGNSFNTEYTIAISYKSIIEFGYTNTTSLVKASMDTDAGIQADGFYSGGKMYYLRGSFPLTSSVDIFALVGDSKFNIYAESVYGCILLCGQAIKISTDSKYLHEESGMAVGVGMAFTTEENNQVTIQYIDYNYRGNFSFKVFTLNYRWYFNIPI